MYCPQWKAAVWQRNGTRYPPPPPPSSLSPNLLDGGLQAWALRTILRLKTARTIKKPRFPRPKCNFSESSLNRTTDLCKCASNGPVFGRFRRARREDAEGAVLRGCGEDVGRKRDSGPWIVDHGHRPRLPPPPLFPSGCCSFTGPWTVTRSSLRMLRRVATFCRPLQPMLLLVSFPRSRSPVVGVLGLC